MNALSPGGLTPQDGSPSRPASARRAGRAAPSASADPVKLMVDLEEEPDAPAMGGVTLDDSLNPEAEATLSPLGTADDAAIAAFDARQTEGFAPASPPTHDLLPHERRDPEIPDDRHVIIPGDPQRLHTADSSADHAQSAAGTSRPQDKPFHRGAPTPIDAARPTPTWDRALPPLRQGSQADPRAQSRAIAHFGMPAQLTGIEVTLTVQIGSHQLPLRDLLSVEPGLLVPLDRMTTEPVDILVNGRLFARGEVVAIGDRFGVRLLALAEASDAR